MQASSSNVAPTHVDPAPPLNVAPTHVDPAPPLVLHCASMNLGGGGKGEPFMTNARSARKYKLRLPAEVKAMLAQRDVVGVTEINPEWFAWLMQQPGFVGDGPYRAVHDDHDVAIFWDRFRVEPTSPGNQVVRPNFLLSEIPVDEDAWYSWRQFITVEFKCLASPQVVFTAACTHSIAGSIKEGPRKTEIRGNTGTAQRNAKDMIARRAMEKALLQCHGPSLVAGNAEALTIFMGDWNVTDPRFKADAEDAINQARLTTVAHTVMTARYQTERDHVVCFGDHQCWHASRVDDIAAETTFAALKACIGKEHKPVFFFC